MSLFTAEISERMAAERGGKKAVHAKIEGSDSQDPSSLEQSLGETGDWDK